MTERCQQEAEGRMGKVRTGGGPDLDPAELLERGMLQIESSSFQECRTRVEMVIPARIRRVLAPLTLGCDENLELTHARKDKSSLPFVFSVE